MNYTSGSKTKGTTLKKELKHLIKKIKQGLKHPETTNWFNRDY
jgi:hypothetical protein